MVLHFVVPDIRLQKDSVEQKMQDAKWENYKDVKMASGLAFQVVCIIDIQRCFLSRAEKKFPVIRVQFKLQLRNNKI